MNKEEKDLLMRDLCARLPYHVRVKVWLEDGDTEEGPLDLQHNYGDVLLDAFYYNKITKIKPYLRPMSSMTEEEDMHRCAFLDDIEGGVEEAIPNYIDFLNEHHFDYNGLIPMGLAIEAPEGMYNL